MKIKDIRQYRTLYKGSRPVDSDKINEQFVGNYRLVDGKREYGWFTLYFGDRDGYSEPEDGIRNFLESFLDMAKDGQAVYEFLQNAVDAGASHFTMAWGKDEIDGNNYVLIANNGRMFDTDSIRSILNIGSSTKSADSKSIGKFGIGFKLAHRLVGKENGLDELLKAEPSGPILFSWENAEIGLLANGDSSPDPVELNYESDQTGNFTIKDRHPWLFKILVTCFPVLPENKKINERIILANGQDSKTPVFSKNELEALKRWVTNYNEILNTDTYKEGSLFFIKLGTGKENDLADKNLAEGVRFSLAILQETAEADKKESQKLSTVQLNKDEPIHKPDLHYHFFKITKQADAEEYIYIRFGVKTIDELTSDQKSKLEKEDDIEVLFGFRDYDKIDDYFKGAPNFYLYFPLSEEVHNFKFVLHSNAFYKASSRTFLHKGTQGEDGINERLLRVIAQRLEKELTTLYEQGEFKKFLNFYAALLTSSESPNIDRQWVREPFVDEITKVLTKLIPVRHSMLVEEFTLSSQKPKIKKTNIEIAPQAFGLSSFNWFYWGPEAPDIIIDKAFLKLNPLPFDIFTLMQKEDIYVHVNQWIEEDRKRITTIFKELEFFNIDKARSDSFKNNLKSLKLFEFTDGKLMSDNDVSQFQEEGYLILLKNLNSVKEIIKKVGLKTSLINLDDFDFFRHYGPYLNTNGQLRSHPKIIELISNGKVENLSFIEKQSVFTSLREMIEEGRRKERLLELRLFKNTTGDCVKLKHLLKSTEKDWLKAYVIDSSERSRDIEIYLESDEDKIYEIVIKPFWEEIAKMLIKSNLALRQQIIADIEQYYQSGNDSDEENISSDSNTLFFQGEICKVENPYFNSGLKRISESNYQAIQSALNDKLEIQIPDYDFLFAYEFDSLKISEQSRIISNTSYEFTKEEIFNFLIFVSAVEFNLFDTYYLSEHEGKFTLLNGQERNYFAQGNQHIETYIEKFHDKEYLKLPDSLAEFGNLVNLKNESLYNELVDKSEEESYDELIDVILSSSLNVKIKLFEKLNNIKLDFRDSELSINKSKLSFLIDLLSEDGLELKNVQDKIIIETETNQVNLSKIDIANDQIVIEHKSLQIKLSRSKLLNLENEKAIPTILSFVDFAVEQSLLTEKIAKRIFKVSSESISDELLTHFLSVLELQEYKILNTDQLILAFHSQSLDSVNLEELEVETINNTWVSIQGNFVILSDVVDLKWYDETKVLSNRYIEFPKKINLRVNEVYSFDTEISTDENNFNNNLILNEFTFQKGVSTEVLKSQENILDLLDFLFKQWKKTPTNSRINLQSEDWERLLQFDPSIKILSNKIIEEELLDESIIQWSQNNKVDKDRFLNFIGVNGSDSRIVKLRNWLMDFSKDESFQMSIEEIPLQLISNTLVGIADGFYQQNESFKCVVNSGKHQFIERLIIKLDESQIVYEIRLPVWLDENHITLGNQSQTLPFHLNQDDYSLLIEKENITSFKKLINYKRIIFFSESYTEYAKRKYPTINFLINFSESENPIEHNEPFYSSWSKENNIQLFRVERLFYDYNIKEENEMIFIGKVEANLVELIEDEHINVIYYKKGLSFENLSEELHKKGFSNESSVVDELIQTRDKMLSAFYHALTLSGRDGFDSEDTKRIMDVLNERSLDEKREDIIELIKSNNRYSYDWFKHYLDYLLTFEELADTISQKSISFQKIEKFTIDGVQSSKYFILKGASSLIPLNIEVFENFSISLIFSNRQRENLVVEGVSKKGQDLLVYVPQGIAATLVSNFDRVVNISINFTPVLDLLQRLANAFSNEEIITPWEDINDSLPPLHFIYGPPGTGKTTKLVDTVIGDFNENHNLKALILVPTNKAGDVLAKRLIEKNNQISVVRIGGPTDPEVEKLDEDIYQVSIDEKIFDYSNVIITTIHRLPYYQIAVEHGPNFKLFDNQKAAWDLVIFDESSMISLPYFAFALHSLHSKNKIIIAGDPKQIPAVVDVSDTKLESLNMVDESIYKMLGIESFDKTEQILRLSDSIDNLDTQYRSVEIIGNLFSTISYKSLLKHGRDFSIKPIKLLPDGFYKPLNSNVSFIDLPLDMNISILEPKKLLYSPYHVYGGIVTAELILNLDKCNNGKKNYTIGVISPYKAQAMLMNKLITSLELSDNLNVYCDTVHGFQGDECDIVIFVINPNNSYFTGHPNSLLSKEYIYNVAISRAKNYLWVVCPYNSLKNNPHVNKLMDVAGNQKTLIQSKEIEKYLFGESDYIVNNTYLTGHDNINVFGQAEMSYFIKAGATAIDIQLRKD